MARFVCVGAFRTNGREHGSERERADASRPTLWGCLVLWGANHFRPLLTRRSLCSATSCAPWCACASREPTTKPSWEARLALGETMRNHPDSVQHRDTHCQMHSLTLRLPRPLSVVKRGVVMAPLFTLVQRTVKKDFSIDTANIILRYSWQGGDRVVQLYFGLPSGEVRLISKAMCIARWRGRMRCSTPPFGDGFVQHMELVGDVGQ